MRKLWVYGHYEYFTLQVRGSPLAVIILHLWTTDSDFDSRTESVHGGRYQEPSQIIIRTEQNKLVSTGVIYQYIVTYCFVVLDLPSVCRKATHDPCKHETLTQCWVNAGSPSSTVNIAQQ